MRPLDIAVLTVEKKAREDTSAMTMHHQRLLWQSCTGGLAPATTFCVVNGQRGCALQGQGLAATWLASPAGVCAGAEDNV